MTEAWTTMIALGAMLLGVATGAFLSGRSYKQTIADLRSQRVEMEGWLRDRESRESKLLIGMSDKLGIASDPHMDPPKTVSRSPRAMARIIQDRKDRDKAQKQAEEYQPVGLTDTT